MATVKVNTQHIVLPLAWWEGKRKWGGGMREILCDSGRLRTLGSPFAGPDHSSLICLLKSLVLSVGVRGYLVGLNRCFFFFFLVKISVLLFADLVTSQESLPF